MSQSRKMTEEEWTLLLSDTAEHNSQLLDALNVLKERSDQRESLIAELEAALREARRHIFQDSTSAWALEKAVLVRIDAALSDKLKDTP